MITPSVYLVGPDNAPIKELSDALITEPSVQFIGHTTAYSLPAGIDGVDVLAVYCSNSSGMFGRAMHMLSHVRRQWPGQRMLGLVYASHGVQPDAGALGLQLLRSGANAYTDLNDGIAGVVDVLLATAYSSPDTVHLPRKLLLPLLSHLQRADPLTSRQLDVALLYAKGMKFADVASSFGLSARTVETHIANVYRKLNIHSRPQLRRWAEQNALM